IARRSQYHQTILIGNANPESSTFLNAVTGLTDKLTQSGFSPQDAQMQAHLKLYQSAQNQAAVLSYIDTFWILAVMAALMFVLSCVLKKNVPGKAGAAAVG